MTQRDVLSGTAGRLRTRALVLAVSGVLTLGACAAPADESEGPAGAVLSAAETQETTAPPTVDPDEVSIDPAPSGTETPSAGRPWDDAATLACQEVVAPGLTQVAQSTDGVGVSTFWTAGETWAVCDAVAGGARLLASGDVPAGFDAGSLSLSSAPAAGGGVRYSAAGLLPWPVQELAYTFPDQHTEAARFVSSEADPEQVWWVLSYTATTGPLAQAEVDTTGLDPVTVSVVGGAAEAFRFAWEELQRSE